MKPESRNSGSPIRVAGTQVFGPSFAAFASVLAGSWNRSGAGGTQVSATMLDASVTGGSLISCAIMTAPLHFYKM